MPFDPWIGVDFDGTLASYGELGTSAMGTPIPLMVERVKRWLAAGQAVRIMTARASATNQNRRQDIERIHMWCHKHLGCILPVTAEKDFGMIALWDDRAVAVEPNFGLALSESDTDPLSIEEELDMTWVGK